MLDPPRGYSGPDAGNPPGIKTPDGRTITFTLSKAHPEWPFLMALPTSTPVPKAKDSGARYETEFVASGPYMRDGAHDRTAALTLKQNPGWDPRSDPIRHQYVGRFVFDFQAGGADDQTNRLIADEGDDQYAVATAAVASSQIAKVQADRLLLARTGQAPTASMDYININTSRVPDVNVRKALNWSFDRSWYIRVVGGAALAYPAGWIMAPTVPGSQDFDAYHTADRHGDPSKAVDLLAGATPKLTYCFPNTPAQQPLADVVRYSIQRAGFQITLRPIDPSSYDSTIGDITNRCDLMHSSWTAGYPDGRSTVDVLMNGEHIVLNGNQNYSLFNEPTINKMLNDLNNEPDRAKAARLYGELDKKIMVDYAPLIPTYNPLFFNLHGSKAHVFASPLFAEFNLVSAWVG